MGKHKRNVPTLSIKNFNKVGPEEFNCNECKKRWFHYYGWSREYHYFVDNEHEDEYGVYHGGYPSKGLLDHDHPDAACCKASLEVIILAALVAKLDAELAAALKANA